MTGVITKILEQWARPLLLLGSAVWLVSWLLNSQTEDGTVAILALHRSAWSVEPTDHIGWALFLAGLALGILGLSLLGVSSLRRTSGENGVG